VSDYAALLARYDVVCVDTVVPTFAAEKDEDALRRFVNFVDVAYESKTLLVAATARPPEDLLVTDRSDGDDQSDDQSDEASPIDSTHSFSTRARVRLEGTRGAFALAESGGASGRSAPMVGDMEWSATGRGGAALADLQATNFTFRAAARCVSRLVEMGGEAYEAAWWEEERARRRLERGSGDEAR
jgi:predicted ATPase